MKCVLRHAVELAIWIGNDGAAHPRQRGRVLPELGERMAPLSGHVAHDAQGAGAAQGMCLPA